MVKFLDINDLRRLVQSVGLKEFFLGTIKSLQTDFRNWQSFQKQPRNVIHYPHGVTELMPIANEEFYSVKYVNGHPYNPLNKKSTVIALGLLAEVKHGYPLLISEMTILTAIRTAATSVLAAQYLANTNSKTMALIGTGAQAEFQALAFHFSLGIKTINYFDVDCKAMEKFAANLSKYEIQLNACKSVKEACNDVDIITTATADKKKAVIIPYEFVRPGMHINGVGGDCPNKTELEKTILHDSKIVVEYLPQTKIEGEIQHHAKSNGVYAELWEIIQGLKPGREVKQEVTLFDSVGFALEDFSILHYVWQLAKQYDIGREIALVPDDGNPKDLFSLLKN